MSDVVGPKVEDIRKERYASITLETHSTGRCSQKPKGRESPGQGWKRGSIYWKGTLPGSLPWCQRQEDPSLHINGANSPTLVLWVMPAGECQDAKMNQTSHLPSGNLPSTGSDRPEGMSWSCCAMIDFMDLGQEEQRKPVPK